MIDKFQDVATFIPVELKWLIFGLHGVLLTLLAQSVLVVWYDKMSQVHFVHSLNPNRSITQKVPIVSDSVCYSLAQAWLLVQVFPATCSHSQFQYRLFVLKVVPPYPNTKSQISKTGVMMGKVSMSIRLLPPATHI